MMTASSCSRYGINCRAETVGLGRRGENVSPTASPMPISSSSSLMTAPTVPVSLKPLEVAGKRSVFALPRFQYIC